MVAAAVLLLAIATKNCAPKFPPKVTEIQLDEDGNVLAVHVMPSGDVAAAVDGPLATATKTPFPKITKIQFDEDGNVLAVHVMPSGEVAAAVPP